MEKFEVHILGCGSALPTAHHMPSSQVVNMRDKLFMIDCGEAAQLQMRRSKLKFSRLSHIFISHLHGDHCFGLPGLISTFDLLGRTAALHIYSPAGLESVMRPWLNVFCRGLAYDVVFHEFDDKASQQIYDDRTVSVTTIPLRHRIPCCGFLFNEKAPLPHIRRDMIDFLKIPYHAINDIKQGADWTDYEGRLWPNAKLVFPPEPARRYAYCSDTCYLPELSSQLQGVDLLYHEATFTHDDEKRALETAHTTALQAATLARDADVGRLIIGHFSARYVSDGVLLNEAKTVFPRTILANENLCVKL